jgi:hypothetical protein
MVLQKLAISAPLVSTEVILLWLLGSSDVEDESFLSKMIDLIACGLSRHYT